MGREEHESDAASQIIDVTSMPTSASRSDDLRFALMLTYLTLMRMTIEGAAALLHPSASAQALALSRFSASPC
jgi:hypothetical protein